MFDPKADADILKNAMKGVGNDKEAIINLASSRTNHQRLQIRDAYKASYGSDLISDFKSELSGHLKDTLVAMFYHPIEYDCLSLRSAMKGIGTDEDTLIEIISTRPGFMIKQIIEKYPTIFEGRNLVEDVKSETSGSFRSVYVIARQYNCKTALTILNGTSKHAVLEVGRYAEVIGNVKRGKDVITGRNVALDKNVNLRPRQTLIVEF